MSGLSLSPPSLSPRRSLPSLCSIVDECTVEIEIQSTPRIYEYFFYYYFLFLRVTPCSSLTARLSGQNCSLSEMQLLLDFFGSGCQ